MKLLFCAEDPGSANAIIPLIRHFRKKEKIQVFGSRFAVSIFEREKITCIDGTHLSAAALRTAVKKFAPGMVLMGTSASASSIEKKITVLCRRLSIPTVSIIDYWSNYERRYSTGSGPRRFDAITDIVCVADARMKREAARSGIPRRAIHVTGNPYFATVEKKIRQRSRAKKQVLFISQPFSILQNRLPYDERKVFTDLLRYPHIKEVGSLVVKLHPKEDRDWFEKFLAAESKLPVPVRISSARTIYPEVSAAALVVGMSSMALLEAALAGKAVMSYQPGIAAKDDILASNRLGISYGARTRASFYKLLDRYRSGQLGAPDKKKINRLRRQYDGQRAIDMIANLIYAIGN